jgi:hypothetical protein
LADQHLRSSVFPSLFLSLSLAVALAFVSSPDLLSNKKQIVATNTGRRRERWNEQINKTQGKRETAKTKEYSILSHPHSLSLSLSLCSLEFLLVDFIFSVFLLSSRSFSLLTTTRTKNATTLLCLCLCLIGCPLESLLQYQ